MSLRIVWLSPHKYEELLYPVCVVIFSTLEWFCCDS